MTFGRSVVLGSSIAKHSRLKTIVIVHVMLVCCHTTNTGCICHLLSHFVWYHPDQILYDNNILKKPCHDSWRHVYCALLSVGMHGIHPLLPVDKMVPWLV